MPITRSGAFVRAARRVIEMDEVLVAGDSGNDADMLRSGALGVVVKNHSSELRYLRGRDRICFTEWPYAHGILEGIDRHGFLPDDQPTLEVEG